MDGPTAKSAVLVFRFRAAPPLNMNPQCEGHAFSHDHRFSQGMTQWPKTAGKSMFGRTLVPMTFERFFVGLAGSTLPVPPTILEETAEVLYAMPVPMTPVESRNPDSDQFIVTVAMVVAVLVTTS